VELGWELCALWKLLFDKPGHLGGWEGMMASWSSGLGSPEFCSEMSFGFVPLLLQCRTPYAAVRTLVLVMVGIMMPETCWDRSLIINIGLVASCWFLSLHPTFMMHGHKSLKFVNAQCVLHVWLYCYSCLEDLQCQVSWPCCRCFRSCVRRTLYFRVPRNLWGL